MEIEEELLPINKNVPGHNCTLPRHEDVTALYIDNGLLVNFRRSFRKFLMVSVKYPRTRSIFKSTAQIRNEEERHLRHHYYMIHPFSEGRFFWETMMIFVYLLQMIIIPIEISAYNETDTSVEDVEMLLSILSYIDVVLFFNTGFYNVESQKIIMEQKKVALHYLFPFFFIDFASSFPVNFMVYHVFPKFEGFTVKSFTILKILRLPTLFRYLKNSYRRWNFSTISLKIVNSSTCFFLALIWLTCITYLFRRQRKHESSFKKNFTLSEKLIVCCRDAVLRLMSVLNTSGLKHKPIDLIFQWLCVILGMVFSLVLLAQIQQFYNRRSSARNKYNNVIQQLGEYMRYKELPNHLREKVFHYVDFKFQKSIYRETDILNTLSSNLRQDILLNNCQRLVEKVDFFKGLPTTLIQRIVSKLKTEIYLPNDVIVQAGIAGNCMYFVHIGTIAVYTSTGKEICHLYDGSHFGEISLVINEPRVASCVAVKECELYRLSRKDFQEAMEPFPEISNKIRISALSRLESTRKIMREHTDPTDD